MKSVRDPYITQIKCVVNSKSWCIEFFTAPRLLYILHSLLCKKKKMLHMIFLCLLMSWSKSWWVWLYYFRLIFLDRHLTYVSIFLSLHFGDFVSVLCFLILLKLKNKAIEKHLTPAVDVFYYLEVLPVLLRKSYLPLRTFVYMKLDCYCAQEFVINIIFINV